MPANNSAKSVAAGTLTAVATAACVLISRVVTDQRYSHISPIWAAIVGFVAPVYAISVLQKNRSRVRRPRLAVAVIAAIVVGVVTLTSALGSQEHDYKIQMIAQFAVLAVCCVIFVPAALDRD